MERPEKLNTLIGTSISPLSGGQISRLMLAKFICKYENFGSIFLIDEITSGNDDKMRNKMLELIKERLCVRNNIVFITSHHSGDLNFCDLNIKL